MRRRTTLVDADPLVVIIFDDDELECLTPPALLEDFILVDVDDDDEFDVIDVVDAVADVADVDVTEPSFIAAFECKRYYNTLVFRTRKD